MIAAVVALYLMANSNLLTLPQCKWWDTSCLAESVQGQISLFHVGACNLTDTACLSAAGAELARVGSRVAANATAHLEDVLGCRFSDGECLGVTVQQAADAAQHALEDATNASANAFLASIGCPHDQVCLQRRAKEIAAQVQLQAAHVQSQAVHAASSAQVQAADAAEASAQRLVKLLGCGAPTDGIEACLLRRAQELGITLSIAASTTVLAGAVGR